MVRLKPSKLTFFTSVVAGAMKKINGKFLKQLNLLITGIMIFTQVVSGQYFNTGQDPSSLKWLQIKTNNFTLIYPDNYGQAGIDLARTLEISAERISSVFPQKKVRLPIVVHNFSTTSNGYVSWAPKRMELFPVKEQDALPGNQDLLLCLHEYTHAYEMTSLNTGFTKMMSTILGQQFTGVVSSLLPMWYLEGNAVVSESVFTNTGRGRSASFQKELKAFSVEKKSYKYDKMLNGSFRDYVPDHYQYGYQIVAWVMTKYNSSIWNNVLDFTGKYPFSVIPVNISLNKQTGLTKRKLYNEAIDSLEVSWKDETKDNQHYTAINKAKKGEFINYFSPLFAGNDSIIAIKTTMSDTPELVIINTLSGEEKTLHRLGYVYPFRIDYGGKKITWVENIQDPRWQNRSYSVVKIYDLVNRTTRSLSRKTRYMSSAISPDGRTICSVENTPDNRNNLVFLDAVTGKIVKTIQSPDNLYLQRPDWSNDGNKITTIFLTDDGEGILSFAPANNLWLTELEPQQDDIQSASLRNDTLFFSGSLNGNENVFIKTGNNITQITDSEFGAVDPDVSSQKMIFSNYSSEGNEIAISDIKALSVSIAGSLKPLISRLENVMNVSTNEDFSSGSRYQPTPYRKWQHPFNIHSWMPFYADIDKIQSDPLSVRPGFTILSQNTLSTLETSAGYEYTEIGEHILHSKILWEGIYPVIDSRIDYSFPSLVLSGNQYTGLKYRGEISLPLRYSSGWFSQYLRPSVAIEHFSNVNRIGNEYNVKLTNFNLRLFFSNYSRTAVRDLFPKWSQTVDFNYIISPFNKDLFGTTFFFRSSFYFPGVFNDNSIRIRLNTEKQDQPKFYLSNSISYPRGYKMIVSKELSSATFDYYFPVAYPDFNISSLLYLKRIRSGLFYDYSRGTGNRHLVNSASGVYYIDVPEAETFRSYGFELISDFHLFRIPFMISAGMQAAWTDLSGRPVISAIFNIDLYGFSLGK
ncbi:MAG TPA: hypothetical protein VHO50_08755 [Bacteroidales bacterium]|nr:hypothetical protein [Bacteroidales bacterium]